MTNGTCFCMSLAGGSSMKIPIKTWWTKSRNINAKTCTLMMWPQTISTGQVKIRTRKEKTSQERAKVKTNTSKSAMSVRTRIRPRRSSRITVLIARNGDTKEHNAERDAHNNQRQIGRSPVRRRRTARSRLSNFGMTSQCMWTIKATFWCFATCAVGDPASQEGTLWVISERDDHICHPSVAVKSPSLESDGTVLSARVETCYPDGWWRGTEGDLRNSSCDHFSHHSQTGEVAVQRLSIPTECGIRLYQVAQEESSIDDVRFLALKKLSKSREIADADMDERQWSSRCFPRWYLLTSEWTCWT